VLHSLRPGPDVPPPPKSLPFLLLSRQRYHRQNSQDDRQYRQYRQYCQYCQAPAALSLVSLADASISIESAVSLHPVRTSNTIPSLSPFGSDAAPCKALTSDSCCLEPRTTHCPFCLLAVSSFLAGLTRLQLSSQHLESPTLSSPALSPSLRGLSCSSPVACHEPTSLSTPPCSLQDPPLSLCPVFSCHYLHQPLPGSVFRPMEFCLHPLPLVTS
jgi:hypothetical protein